MIHERDIANLVADLDDDPEMALLMDRWGRSPRAFAECFRLKDKNRREVEFRTSVPQRIALEALSKNQKNVFLKGRQMWITTILLVWQLRLCLFKPGAICVVGMQTDFNAKQMKFTAQNLYAGNEILAHEPSLRMGIDRENDHELRFDNGAQMLFVTANSPVLRSMPLTFVHLSEVRDYEDLGETLASIKIAPEGGGCLESTAGGEDDFYNVWTDPDSAWSKTFFCWRDHLEYRDARPFEYPLTESERDYIKLHDLEPEEAQWWVRERRGLPLHKRPLMISEHPSTHDEAFRLSGDKFLLRQLMMPTGDAPDADEQGIVKLHDYDPTHEYVAGIDPAPGSSEKGDPTAMVILDKTARNVALVQEIRMPLRDYEKLCLETLKGYGSPTTVIETAQEGLGLCDFLRGAGIPMYHMTAFGGLNPEMLPRHGWRTDSQTRGILFGGIYYVSDKQNGWTLDEHRLVKQVNALCYNKRGKPAAPKNGNDDIAVALGCAMQGLDQALPAAKATEPEVTMTPLEALLAELKAPTTKAAEFFDLLKSNQSDFFE